MREIISTENGFVIKDGNKDIYSFDRELLLDNLTADTDTVHKVLADLVGSDNN